MSHFQILPGTGNRGPHSKEKYFIYIRERYKWLLEMGGEKVLLYKKKYTGTRCPLFDQVRKTSQQHGQDNVCYGTGFVGGYFKPIEIYVSILTPVQEAAIVKDIGRVRTFKPTSWTLWEPIMSNGDFIVRRNNERLLVTDYSVTKWKHYIMRQNFNLIEVERNSPIYQVP